MDPCKLDAVHGIPEELRAKAFRILCTPDSLKSEHPARANIMRENLAHELQTVHDFQMILRNIIAGRIQTANQVQNSLSTPVTENENGSKEKSPYDEYAATLDGLVGKLNEIRGNLEPVLAEWDPKATVMAAYWYKRFGTVDESAWLNEATRFTDSNRGLLMHGFHAVRHDVRFPYKMHQEMSKLGAEEKAKEKEGE
ncbi:MAG: hypothetical protein LQ350_006748 [Teloschistes chrysophthalmus]|nr:MAG: hypothetical protein LQ350_006748 [Niorma chrysophthalma]